MGGWRKRDPKRLRTKRRSSKFHTRRKIAKEARAKGKGERRETPDSPPAECICHTLPIAPDECFTAVCVGCTPQHLFPQNEPAYKTQSWRIPFYDPWCYW